MSVVKDGDITKLFADGPLSGTQVIEGIISLMGKKYEQLGVGTLLPTVRHVTLNPGDVGDESVAEAAVKTLRDGLKSRLPDPFPKGIGEIHIYYGDNPSLYVRFVNLDGRYNLG